jgi:hypothetical protein
MRALAGETVKRRLLPIAQISGISIGFLALLKHPASRGSRFAGEPSFSARSPVPPLTFGLRMPRFLTQQNPPRRHENTQFRILAA